MDEATIVTIAFQVALTAALGFFFNWRLKRSETAWREESERNAHAYKWSHDKRRSVEERLLEVSADAKNHVTRCCHKVLQIKADEEKNVMWKNAIDSTRIFTEFLVINAAYIDENITGKAIELSNQFLTCLHFPPANIDKPDGKTEFEKMKSEMRTEYFNHMIAATEKCNILYGELAGLIMLNIEK